MQGINEEDKLLSNIRATSSNGVFGLYCVFALSLDFLKYVHSLESIFVSGNFFLERNT